MEEGKEGDGGREALFTATTTTKGSKQKQPHDVVGISSYTHDAVLSSLLATLREAMPKGASYPMRLEETGVCAKWVILEGSLRRSERKLAD